MLKRAFMIIGILVCGMFIASPYMLGSDACAFNKPWDQGHDGTNPDDPPDPDNPPDPPNDPHGGTASPVYIRSGNFVVRFIDLSFQACGKPIKVTRDYNSFDKHNGLLGFGWTLSYSIRLLDTRANSGEDYVLVLMPNGQRYKFTRNADDTYTPPPGTIFTLSKENGDFVLEDNLNLVYRFDSEGFIESIVDKSGNEVTLTYQNFGGCLDQVSDANGRALTFTFGANGKIASIADPAGNTVLYEYDANGDLVGVTDPEDGRTQYSYDAKHNLLSIVNPDGDSVVSATYETAEPYRVKTYTQGGDTFTVTYLSANQSRKTNSLVQNTTYDFLDNGLITKVTSPLNHIIQHGYDAAFNYNSFTDPNGHLSGFAYDSGRNLVQQTDPLGNSYTMTYDPQDNVTGLTNPLGNAATFAYDAGSNLTTVTRPTAEVLNIAYDSLGYITSVTRGAESLSFTRDANCNLTRMQSDGGSSVQIAYDSLGNPTAVTQNGATTDLTYNRNNKITEVATGSDVTSLGYDQTGRVTSVAYPGGPTMAYSYSSVFGRVDKITFPDNSFFEYDYEPFGRLKTLKNQDNEIRSFSYDADHRLTRVIFPSGNMTDYQYDAGNNVTKIIDSKVGSIDLVYDAANRLVSVADGTMTHAFAYDAAGNRTTKTDNGNITTYTYDALNRLTAVTESGGGTTTFSPPLRNLANAITLNDIIGLYNSRQNIRLLSYLAAYSPNEIVNNIIYDLQFLRYQHGIDERLLTGFSAFELPHPDSYSVPQVLSLIDFLKIYKRLGFDR